MAKNYRDGLFRDYFNDKVRLLDLCNLLLGTDGTDPDEIIINTLEGTFFSDLKNDISCLYRNEFILMVEHQSRINENMPLRGLFYVTELLKQYTKPFKKKLHAEEKIKLPTPKMFVFYNGNEEEVEQREMKLSDAFDFDASIEMIVKMYNINAGMNEKFISTSKYLKNYCTFVNRVKKNLADNMDLDHAIAEAIDYCISHDIMADYLKTKEKEVISMVGFEYDENLAREGWIARGEARGEAIGKIQGALIKEIEIAKKLLDMKMSVEFIVEATGLSEKEILKFAKD